jgi:hypothetical protein
MSFALVFADSEVRDVVADGTAVRVRFSAASVRCARGDRGWLSAVVLTLDDATLAGDATHAFGRITEGRLRHDGAALARLALPATLAGDLELSLRLANGTSLSVRALALALAVAPDAVFTEDLSC